MFALIITLVITACISGLYGITHDNTVAGIIAMAVFGGCVGSFGLLGILDMGLWHPANYGWFWWVAMTGFTIGGYGLSIAACFIARWLKTINN